MTGRQSVRMTEARSVQRAVKPWSNWGRSESGHPVARVSPTTVEAVQDAVVRARTTGQTVKAIGAGHSFSAIAVTDGVQLSLDGLSGLLSVDAGKQQATFAAGTRLFDVPGLLAPYGLAMPNLGDIDRQSLAGAISTGTHGTGAAFGGIATQVTGMVVVTADGGLLCADREQNSELLPALRVGLGALGIIVEVTLQCVPAFSLQAVEKPIPLDEVLATLDERFETEDHFEFHWFPHSEVASTKTNTRRMGHESLRPRGALDRFLGDTVVANGLFRALCNVERLVPALTPGVNRIAARQFANAEFTDASHRVFATSRGVRFREMEYALPRAELIPVFQQVRELIGKRGWRIEFPIEVRAAAADENWLSTAYGRETGYLAVHRFFRHTEAEFFPAVEEIFTAHGGRPHWGKMHTRELAYLQGVYPKMPDFLELRRELDPTGLFGTAYLRRVLGG